MAFKVKDTKAEIHSHMLFIQATEVFKIGGEIAWIFKVKLYCFNPQVSFDSFRYLSKKTILSLNSNNYFEYMCVLSTHFEITLILLMRN